jgi:Mce-associated membrane protein
MTASYAAITANAVPGWVFVLVGVGAVILVLTIAAMWRVFLKAGQPGWAAIVPFYNLYVLTKIAGRPGWWMVLLILPGVNIVFGIIVAIDVAKAFGKSTAFGVLGLFFFSPVGYVVLGYGDARYHADADDVPDDEVSLPDANYLLLGGVALVVVAAMAALWFGAAWITSANDASLSRATARDEVDRIGRAAIQTFNTLDYHKADEGLDNWLNASTGKLHDEVVGRRESSKQALVAAKAVTTAEVLSLAVTELNDFEGRATVIAALKIVVNAEGQQPTDKYQRIQGVLERVGNDWKLSGIGPVDFARS